MSYHGGMIGIVLAFIVFCYKRKINHWQFADMGVPGIPAGYTFGRMGNFINGELYGKITDLPWGMYFPTDPTHQLRHPTQLYEAFFEGIFLFVIFWTLRNKSPFYGFLPGLYLMGYGIVRFFIEFYRMPDEHLGTILFFLTTGQILCLAMIAGGIVFWLFAKKYQPAESNN
jgi:phosphatidylglycerol:prolipoprotein diacylglycerol transferase